MEKTIVRQKLPNTDSIEELARFWDTHDLTDFEEDLEEVGEPVFVRTKGTSLSIDLPPAEARHLKKIARSKGVRETSVVRQWILERLSSLRALAGRPTPRCSGRRTNSAAAERQAVRLPEIRSPGRCWVMTRTRSKTFDCVQVMRQARDRFSAEITDKSYGDLVRWLRSHRYADPSLQRLAGEAAQRGAAADTRKRRGRG